MPNIMSVLKQEIVRLARKELKSQTLLLKKASAQHRRDIAALKRQVAGLNKPVAVLQKAVLKKVPVAPLAAGSKVRFTDALKLGNQHSFRKPTIDPNAIEIGRAHV